MSLASTGGLNSRVDAKLSESKKASRTWYVQFEDVKNKTVVEKLSTGRVLKMIKAGLLTAKARAKASADGAYLPLVQYPEFKDAIEE